MGTAKTKTCSACGDSRPTTAYCARTDARDGLQSWCRDCQARATRLWEQSPKGKVFRSLYETQRKLDQLQTASGPSVAKRRAHYTARLAEIETELVRRAAR